MAGDGTSAAGSAPLILSLFGPLKVRVHGRPLPCPLARKEQGLLALLVFRSGAEVERLWLAGTLWPDSSPGQALHNLRNSLTHLRRALGPEGDRLRSPSFRTLTLDLSGASVDVVAFDTAIARGDPASLERAVALHRGPLLEGWVEEWVFQERRVREEAYLRALESLARHARESEDVEAAERHLRRVVEVDPLRESAQRELMQTLAEGGNYAAALEVYRELRLRLHQELNAAPDPETVALFEQLRAEARRRAALACRSPGVSAGGPALSKRREPIVEDPQPAKGMVTFLFTDVESSTRLWEQHPDVMRDALARHDVLAAALIAQHRGTLVKNRGEGDSLFAVFARPTEALASALALQKTFLAEPWPQQLPLRIRMALHTGEADVRESDYYGPAVNRCARLRAAAHGGQVLISAATQELVRDHLPEGMSLRDLGECHLRDLTRPERLYQLVHPHLPAEFPPLRGLDVRADNLPVQPTPLVGREEEVAALREMLLREEVRLLTLTGPGGTGKTRLALQVAAELLDEFADGVFSVELASIRDPALVAPTIAQTLGLRQLGEERWIDLLKRALHEKQRLLLLDNFEQVLDAAPIVAELLATSPRLKVLITSRAVLHVRGEYQFAVPPLALPDPNRLPAAEALSQYASVQLFIQRAIAAKSSFELTDENARAVAEICVRLDGLPLAIELAAARIKLFAPQALLSRLSNRLKLLTGGARDLPARQQTLRDTIAWSYDLLSESEQGLFRQLCVFAGGFTLEAGEAVYASGEAIDLIASLLDKSLLREVENEDEQRFGILETIREFGRECLVAAGEEAAVRERHAHFFLALAEEADPYLRRAERRQWMRRLVPEKDNFRAALAWCLESPERAELALRLAGALTWFWNSTGDWTEARTWLKASLATNASDGCTRARAKALFGAGYLAWTQGDSAAARAPLEQAVALWREVGEKKGLAVSLTHLAIVMKDLRDPATAPLLLEESLPLSRDSGGTWNVVSILLCRGILAHLRGDRAAEEACYEEAVAVARTIGDPTIVAWSLMNLGDVARTRGDYATAIPLLEESVGLFREEDPLGLGRGLHSLGMMTRDQGDLVKACAYLEESIAIWREVGGRRELVATLLPRWWVARDQGDTITASALAEQVIAVAEEVKDQWLVAYSRVVHGYTAYLRGDARRAETLLQEGLALGRPCENRWATVWALTYLAEVADACGSNAVARVWMDEGLGIWRELTPGLEWSPLRADGLRRIAWVAQHQGDPERAQSLFRESLTICRALGARPGVAESLEGLAAIAAIDLQPARAGRLFGAAAALREAISARLPAAGQAEQERHLTTLRSTLGEEEFAAAWAEGRAMTLEDAVALALGETHQE